MPEFSKGQRVWVEAEVRNDYGDGDVQLQALWTLGDVETFTVGKAHILTTPPMSPEDQAIVEAAVTYMTSSSPNSRALWERLGDAVQAKCTAQKQSLEDDLKALMRDCLEAGLGIEPRYESEYMDFVQRALAIVDAHRPAQAGDE